MYFFVIFPRELQEIVCFIYNDLCVAKLLEKRKFEHLNYYFELEKQKSFVIISSSKN